MILDKSEVDEVQIMAGGDWIRERWWYRLIQVCRRWRYLVLESAHYLQVSLVCARGTPVAVMLAHSPPFPIIIDHFDEYQDLTADDEEGIILALQHRDRVRRIRIMKPIPILQKLIVTLDGKFPILEYLFIQHQRYHHPEITLTTHLNFLETFRAPHLRQLSLENFAIPIESPLLTNLESLTDLSLIGIPSSVYFCPNDLLQRLAFMPRLETLGIDFNCYIPSRGAERELSRMPIMTRVTLPNLRWLGFRGTNDYLEALLPHLTIPLLETLQVYFFNRMIYSIPHLRQLMSAASNLRIKTATFRFRRDRLNVEAYPHKGARLYSLATELGGRHLDWQVVSAVQVFHALRTVFSAVEDLVFEYNRRFMSSEWTNEADRTNWRELLGSFVNVKTLTVDGDLVEQLSRALQPDEEESSTELLPELEEISYSAIGAPNNAFTLFIDARRKAGRPVTVLHPTNLR